MINTKAQKLLSQSVSQSVSLITHSNPLSFVILKNLAPKNLGFFTVPIINFLLSAPYISIAEKLKEVTVEGLAIIGSDITKSEARAIALNNTWLGKKWGVGLQ